MVKMGISTEDVKKACESEKLAELYELAERDPAGLFSKLTKRLMGKNRLRWIISATNQINLLAEKETKTFIWLLRLHVEKELGISK